MYLTIFIILTILSTLGLKFSYRSNPTRLLNGFLFMLTILFSIITITLFVFKIDNHWLNIIYLLLLVISIFSVLIFYYLQGFLWLWNAWIVWHRESHSLANSLTLIIGIITIIFILFSPKIPSNFIFIRTFILLTILYIIFCILSFTSSALLFTIRKPKPDKKYIIILGAGLLNGNQVSPLLASRINKGIEFFHQVEAKNHTTPLIICSGGKGGNETIPEGVAMRNYAIKQGISPEKVIAEDKSKTTLQNMLFSKKIIEKLNIPINSGVYVSNNYHIFRAGIYAKQAGLNIPGLGTKTSKFFIPNAIIREYVALLANHKKFHIIMLLLILIISILSAYLAK